MEALRFWRPSAVRCGSGGAPRLWRRGDRAAMRFVAARPRAQRFADASFERFVAGARFLRAATEARQHKVVHSVEHAAADVPPPQCGIKTPMGMIETIPERLSEAELLPLLSICGAHVLPDFLLLPAPISAN